MAITSLADYSNLSATKAPTGSGSTSLKAMAEEFETVFLSSMFGQITSLLDGDGPLGGQGAGGDAWRAMLTDELAKSVSRSGGVGIARSVHAELLALQAAETSSHDGHTDTERQNKRSKEQQSEHDDQDRFGPRRRSALPLGGGAS